MCLDLNETSSRYGELDCLFDRFAYPSDDSPETDGGNIKKARRQIEHITDTLTVGFEKQLDALYQSDAMDVAGEISVLENMLKRDGFSDDDELKLQMPSH